MGGDDLSIFKLSWGGRVGSFSLEQEPRWWLNREYIENHNQGGCLRAGH